MSDINFKEKLNPEQYRVMREKDTERPFSGRYWDHDEGGLYACAACGNILFSSLSKRDTESGWPSFANAIDERSVDLIQTDKGTEITCQNCHSHVGYLATEEGESDTYYRVNSAALEFTEFPELPEDDDKDESKKEGKQDDVKKMTMQAFLALLASIVVGTGIGYAAGTALCGPGISLPAISASPTPSASVRATPVATVVRPLPSPTPTPPKATPVPTDTPTPDSSVGGTVPTP